LPGLPLGNGYPLYPRYELRFITHFLREPEENSAVQVEEKKTFENFH
jgi:hypothetical protein